jgi:glutamine---fructose-6-phosphate transaminase (isomerizing)
MATAYQSALIMSESTKLCFNGMTMAQYDHGPKETAADSIVINIVAKGKSYERAQKLIEVIVDSGAHVITVEEPEVEEHFSIINNIVPFNFMAYYLAKKLNINETFVVGGKVTEVL